MALVSVGGVGRAVSEVLVSGVGGDVRRGECQVCSRYRAAQWCLVVGARRACGVGWRECQACGSVGVVDVRVSEAWCQASVYSPLVSDVRAVSGGAGV